VPVVSAAAVGVPEGRHGLLQCGERRQGIPLVPAAVLDDVLPPPFGVVVAGGAGQHAQGVDAYRVPRTVGLLRVVRVFPAVPVGVPCVLCVVGALGVVLPRQGVGGGQVDEAGRDPVVDGP